MTRDTPQNHGHPPGPVTPGAVHHGRYRHRAAGTHPTGMHSCLNCVCIFKDNHVVPLAFGLNYRPQTKFGAR